METFELSLLQNLEKTEQSFDLPQLTHFLRLSGEEGPSDPGSVHLFSPAVQGVPFQGQGQIQHRNVESVERRCFQLDPRGG